MTIALPLKRAAFGRLSPREATRPWTGAVENILIRRCVFANDRAGNVLEIGHETSTSHMRNIRFEDCDVLHCHGNGAVFAIHVCDRAEITDVVYQDISVEHFWDKLIDFRIMRSIWGRDERRGQVRNITLRRVYVNFPACNVGYSISVVGGWDSSHPIENVLIEDLFLADEKVTSLDGSFEIFTRHVRGLTVC